MSSFYDSIVILIINSVQFHFSYWTYYKRIGLSKGNHGLGGDQGLPLYWTSAHG